MVEERKQFLVNIIKIERLKKMKIGNVELENNIFLAPMAGITDLPFRLICKKFGPGLVCSEMVSSKALMYNDEKTKLLLESHKDEEPLSIQIFGKDLDAIAYATKYLNDNSNAVIIDINMGCPAPKVTKNGEGSKLLLDLNLVKEIVETAVKNSNIPITVKMRTGWDSENIVAVEAAKIIEAAGASAITIHGRTRSQFYSGNADWDIIKEVKKSVKIPVIGNGDINNAIDAKKMLDYTNVDGIMIGRAAMGNPWIFREVIHYLKTGEILDGPSNEERLEIIMEHIKLACEYKREDVAIKEMRKHISAYTKGLKNSSEIRSKINTLQTRKEVEEELVNYFRSLKQE